MDYKNMGYYFLFIDKGRYFFDIKDGQKFLFSIFQYNNRFSLRLLGSISIKIDFDDKYKPFVYYIKSHDPSIINNDVLKLAELLVKVTVRSLKINWRQFKKIKTLENQKAESKKNAKKVEQHEVNFNEESVINELNKILEQKLNQIVKYSEDYQKKKNEAGIVEDETTGVLKYTDPNVSQK